MKKEQFFEELRKHLGHLSQEEIDDIIRDQEEYIRDAMQRGRSEEEVIASLGDPKAFANSVLIETRIQEAQTTNSINSQFSSTFKAVIAFIALTPLNILFVLIPFMLFVIFTILGWTIALGILVAACITLLVFFFKLVFMSAAFWTHLAFFFTAMGFVGIGLLAIICAYYMTRFFMNCVLSYLRWNLNFIKNRM